MIIAAATDPQASDPLHRDPVNARPQDGHPLFTPARWMAATRELKPPLLSTLTPSSPLAAAFRTVQRPFFTAVGLVGSGCFAAYHLRSSVATLYEIITLPPCPM